LVFACPDFSKIAPQEINEIENWVREDGGGLLLLSHAGGDKGRQTNLTSLAERFGIVYENDQVLSPQNYGMENLPKVSTFSPPHPITEGVTEICYRAGCSLTSFGGPVPIALSDEDAEPFSVPLIIVSEADNGMVCAIGSYEIFRDEIGCGIEHEQHKKLASNIFNWLISEYRLKLKEKDPSLVPSEKTGTQAPIVEGIENIGVQKFTPITLKSEIKISSKSDLIQTLYSVLNELDALKNIVEELIESVVVSEDEIIELKAIEEMQKKVQKPPKLEEPLDLTKDFAKIKKESQIPTEDEGLSDLTKMPEKPSDIKPLPPRPEGMAPPKKKTEEKEIIEEDVIAEKKLSKKEIKAQLEGLESKINSVNNLINFLKKKKKDGKIKQNDFDKQMKKLNYDLETTTKKIDTINKFLKKKK
jgi:hypothetical protein